MQGATPTKKRNQHTYLINSKGRFFSCFGEDREKIVAKELASGGQVILHWDFSSEETEHGIQMFGDGVREGYELALESVRRALGVRS